MKYLMTLIRQNSQETLELQGKSFVQKGVSS